MNEPSKIDIDRLAQWKGRQEIVDDIATHAPVAALTATLDRDDLAKSGDALPPLWHWLYFLPHARQSQIGADGHPKRGGFMPPVELPRRMWAGGRLRFGAPLRVGDSIRRTSTIADVSAKHGRTGSLVFVLVKHEIESSSGGRISEEQDIVFRDMPSRGDAPPLQKAAPLDAAWRRDIAPDPVLLFRFSALTFNGHRIHYDRSYATEAEFYPGLVVHGPLIATLLADLARRNNDRALSSFDFRAVSPLFDTAPFAVCGAPTDGGARLWAQNSSGGLAMEAEARFT